MSRCISRKSHFTSENCPALVTIPQESLFSIENNLKCRHRLSVHYFLRKTRQVSNRFQRQRNNEMIKRAELKAKA